MTFWTNEKVEHLKKLVKEGHGYTYISQQLKCSRNAAIGKTTRLKLNKTPVHTKAARSERSKPKTVQVKKKTKPLPPEPPPAPPAPPPEPKVEQPKEEVKPTKPLKYRKRVRLPMELKDDYNFELFWQNKDGDPINDIHDIPSQFECKWIDGDVRSGKACWCRKPTVGITSWCKYHSHVVYPPHTVYKKKPPKTAVQRK